MSYEINDDLYPATAVCFIESTWGNQTYIGTGFIVGQNNDVLTAAHVIYDGRFGRVADSIKVYPSYDPDDFNNVFYRPNKVEYFPNFDPNNDGYILAKKIFVFFRKQVLNSILLCLAWIQTWQIPMGLLV